MKFTLRAFVLSAFFLLTAVSSVYADTVAYTDPALQGSQAWGGNMALNFDVNSPITVTDLGVFNASGTGMITGTIQVVIFNTITSTEVTPVVTFQGSYATGGLGFDVFQAITPVVLGPGSYEIDAVGFSSTDLNGNLNTGSSSGPILDNGGGALTFTGASWDSSVTLDEPLTCPTCQPAPAQFSQFDAGTFKFIGGLAATPEPGSLSLLAAGLGLMVLIFRRR